MRLLSRLHTLLYRITGGRVGARLVNNDMLLLTTRGRRTGRPHTVPLLYLADGDTKVVFASWGGRPSHPEWYRNLLAQPLAQVEVRGEKWTVRARTVEGAERQRWWEQAVRAYPGYAEYQAKTDRLIPVVLLEPLPGSR